MLKENETEETIGFFVTFLSLVAFQLGGARIPYPLPLSTLRGIMHFVSNQPSFLACIFLFKISPLLIYLKTISIIMVRNKKQFLTKQE